MACLRRVIGADFDSVSCRHGAEDPTPLVLSETLVERGRALKYYIALPIFFSSRESSWGACHVSIAYCGDPGTSPMFRVCHRDNDDLLTFVTKSDKLHHLAHQGRLSRGHFRKTKAGCGARARIDAIRSRAALGHRSAGKRTGPHGACLTEG